MRGFCGDDVIFSRVFKKRFRRTKNFALKLTWFLLTAQAFVGCRALRQVQWNAMHFVRCKFSVSVGLLQGCFLFPLMFIIYMDKIDRDSCSSSGVKFGECNVWHLMFTDNLALLSSSQSDLEYYLINFLTHARMLG